MFVDEDDEPQAFEDDEEMEDENAGIPLDEDEDADEISPELWQVGSTRFSVFALKYFLVFRKRVGW